MICICGLPEDKHVRTVAGFKGACVDVARCLCLGFILREPEQAGRKK